MKKPAAKKYRDTVPLQFKAVGHSISGVPYLVRGGRTVSMSSSLAWLASTLSRVEMALTASLAVDSDLGSVYCTLSWEIRSTANT
jgi:hypothetical protein